MRHLPLLTISLVWALGAAGASAQTAAASDGGSGTGKAVFQDIHVGTPAAAPAARSASSPSTPPPQGSSGYLRVKKLNSG